MALNGIFAIIKLRQPVPPPLDIRSSGMLGSMEQGEIRSELPLFPGLLILALLKDYLCRVATVKTPNVYLFSYEPSGGAFCQENVMEGLVKNEQSELKLWSCFIPPVEKLTF